MDWACIIAVGTGLTMGNFLYALVTKKEDLADAAEISFSQAAAILIYCLIENGII